MNETYIKLLNCLEEVGIFCDETEEDINLRDYNIDSYTFIIMIVNIEDTFGFTMPDYLMNYESFCSLVAVANYIDEVKMI